MLFYERTQRMNAGNVQYSSALSFFGGSVENRSMYFIYFMREFNE